MLVKIKFDVLILYQQIPTGTSNSIEYLYEISIVLLFLCLKYSSRLLRRQLSTIGLTVEVRDDPITNLSSGTTTAPTEHISNICSSIINHYQSGEIQQACALNLSTGNTTPIDLSIQEPFNQTSVSLSIIHRIELVTAL